MKNSKQPILFFDGDCAFCNRWVRFFVNNERNQNMLFSPIDSEGTERWLSENGIDGFQSDSIHVYVENTLFSKSTAVLKLIPFLRPGWSLFLGLWLVPKCIRDWVYDLIAKNRQYLGGQCELMSVKKDRLL